MNSTMKTTIQGLVSALALTVSAAALAQASAPMSSGEVKPTKTGSLPAGQGPNAGSVSPETNGMTDKTRAERKATTKGDRSSGALQPTGDAADMKADNKTRATPTMNSRADRKADTKAAVKAGTTQPAGEAAQPVAAPPAK